MCAASPPRRRSVTAAGEASLTSAAAMHLPIAVDLTTTADRRVSSSFSGANATSFLMAAPPTASVTISPPTDAPPHSSNGQQSSSQTRSFCQSHSSNVGAFMKPARTDTTIEASRSSSFPSLMQPPPLFAAGGAAPRPVPPSSLLSAALDAPLFHLTQPDPFAGSATSGGLGYTRTFMNARLEASMTTGQSVIGALSSMRSEDAARLATLWEVENGKAALPSNRVPPPSVLLIALADLDALRDSLLAHTAMWTAKEQVGELKRLIAHSMRAELSSAAAAVAASTAAKNTNNTGGVRSRSVAGFAADDVSEHQSEEAPDNANQKPAETSEGTASSAHDAAIRAALSAAHGFLHGTEQVPIGVPKAHLQRARRNWVRQYRQANVLPRLIEAQRRRYEAWMMDAGAVDRAMAAVGATEMSMSTRPRPQHRGLSVTFACSPTAPVVTCAGLRPSYWQSTNVEKDGRTEGSVINNTSAADAPSPSPPPIGTASRVNSQSAVRRSRVEAVSRRYTLPASVAANQGKTGTQQDEMAITAVWELDFHDDLRLVVMAEQRDQAADTAASKNAVEMGEPVASAASASVPARESGMRDKSQSNAAAAAVEGSSSPTAAGHGTSSSSPSMGSTQLDRVAALRQRHSTDLTQVQVPLPVFVYVISRHLFLSHYSTYFPPGLFSAALLNPYYFPDAEQFSLDYAWRTTPALRSEAHTVASAYAASLQDAHQCFPERVASLEMPLPANDTLHLWELLCPPQRVDRLGRWRPVSWGVLPPEAEDALLIREYGDASTHAAVGLDGHQIRTGGGSLLRFAYARFARRVYRERLQMLAQHPGLLAEVQQLLSICEDVAARFFSSVDSEQRGCVSWEALTNSLIEEADIQDHQLKVREHAAQLTRASASVFDRYVVEPVAPTLVRLGYTGAVMEVRHSAALILLEGAADYAVCDGLQRGSILQRFMVRPMKVVLRELESVLCDAFGRPLRQRNISVEEDIAGLDDGIGGGDGTHGTGGDSGAVGGYDLSLQRRPWRQHQRPVRAYTRYEDGRQLQESSALSVLYQLGADNMDGGLPNSGKRADAPADGATAAVPVARLHTSAEAVTLQQVMVVMNVSPLVPWPIFVARGNDMLLRLYNSNHALQAMPETGLLRCAETVTCMEWASGGPPNLASLNGNAAARSRSGAIAGSVGGSAGNRNDGGSSNSRHIQRPAASRYAVKSHEYMLIGTRSGQICVVDLYAIVHRVPRLTAFSAVSGNSAHLGGGGIAVGGGADALGGRGDVAASSATAARMPSERFGSSSNAWSGYRVLARRTFYHDLDPFAVHRRQVHATDTLVSSVVVSAANGLAVSSGLDGTVCTMRLRVASTVATSPTAIQDGEDEEEAAQGSGSRTYAAARRRLRPGGAMAATAPSRPAVQLEVLQRISVCDVGVRYALPVPSLSLVIVQTVPNRLFVYHTSVLPTAPALVNGGRHRPGSRGTSAGKTNRGRLGGGGEGSGRTSPSSRPQTAPTASLADAPDSPSANNTTTSASGSNPSRLELYDAAAPHFGDLVSITVNEELDQLISVDSTAYVKVWSLRQSQPITSFYAVAPFNAGNQQNGGEGNGGGGGGHEEGGDGPKTVSSRTGTSTVKTADGADSDAQLGAILRITRHTIESAVEVAASHMQPCLTTAYNVAGRQLFVMGTDNAALCYFVSGESSARAHTNPVRALLVETTAAVPGAAHVHRRLITLSSADCRIWSLETGSMELGIRASNAEYRQLFDHRLTGNAQTAEERGGASGRGGGGVEYALGSAVCTSGGSWRLMSRTVEDVMRAVSTRTGSASARRRRQSSAQDRVQGLTPRPPVRGATWAKKRDSGGGSKRDKSGVPSSGLDSPPSVTTKNHTAASADAAASPLSTALRDQNILTSDIRCACLGPDGQWVAYALLHGDIRLHRSDSGRLLHTFITTPPTTSELTQAALRFERLFGLQGGVSAPTVLGTSSSAAASPLLSPAAFAQAVAAVLQRLVTPGGSGHGLRTASSFGTVGGGGGNGGVQEGRDMHREPLAMFYVETAHELFVAYADGVVRVFTLLGHRTTAARVMVSRTLVSRAIVQVQEMLRVRQQRTVTGFNATGGVEAEGGVQLQELLLLGSGTDAAGFAAESHAGPPATGSHLLSSSVRRESSRTSSVARRGPGAPISPCQASVVVVGGAEGEFPSTAAPVGASHLVLTSPAKAEFASAATGTRPLEALAAASSSDHLSPAPAIETDVVLLATASPALGLLCLVHASGLVTVIDVLAQSEAPLATLGVGVPPGRDAAAGSGGGTGGAGAQSAAPGGIQAGVVLHSFHTADEVTAVAFLGAYPCLLLADRQRRLTFHLVKGASLLALLGDIAERLHTDAAAAIGSAKAKPVSTSSTHIWTLSIDGTCATSHSVGTVTVLAFDPLYATVYVGTSQGYLLSYLVRRLLLAFQLTPVYLRGADGIALATYAAELQRAVAREALGPVPTAVTTRAQHHFLLNVLQVVLRVPQDAMDHASTAIQQQQQQQQSQWVEGAQRPLRPVSSTMPERSKTVYRDGSLLSFYEAHPELLSTTSVKEDLSGGRRRWHASGLHSVKDEHEVFLEALAESPAALYVAAAVLHDGVTRIHATAAAAWTSLSSSKPTQSALASSSPKKAVDALTASTDAPSAVEQVPWWEAPSGGQLVRDYMARYCGDAAQARTVTGLSPCTTTRMAPPPPGAAEIVLDELAVALLSRWIHAAVAEVRGTEPTFLSAAEVGVEQRAPVEHGRVCPTSAKETSAVGGGYNVGGPRAHSREESRAASATLPPNASPLPLNGSDSTGAASPNKSEEKHRTPANAPTSPRSLARELVREVEEELLLGDSAMATQRFTTSHAAGAATGRRGAEDGTEEVGPQLHPITFVWAEPLFTRRANMMASRSPLALLTPPAMLERARREFQDRRARGGPSKLPATVAAGGATGDVRAVEWDAYVEGSAPDYLTEMLNRPGQVPHAVERQALQQQGITTLLCRSNGYLCVGHADGEVTLWTPYACGRLEGLCPTTAFHSAFDRLGTELQAQFRQLHEAAMRERQRMEFDGAAHHDAAHGTVEEAGRRRMKQRIRKLLLQHHVAQLHDSPSTSSSAFMTVYGAQYLCGPLEQQLMSMQPLLCLLLGVATPAELHARQMTLEDLCFLPLHRRSLAAMEGFDPTAYDAAVELAVCRLRRELSESANIDVTGPFTPTSTMNGNGGGGGRGGGVRCLYEQPLPELVKLLYLPFHPPQMLGVLPFPGAVRLLLHHAVEYAAAPSSVRGGARGASGGADSGNSVTQAPMEGQYWEVCHALQLAEMHAESTWEACEQDRLQTRVRASQAAASSATTAITTSALMGQSLPSFPSSFFSGGAAGDLEAQLGSQERGDGCNTEGSTQLSPRGATAVSAVLQQQQHQQLTSRLAAASRRAACAALLHGHVHLQEVPSATSELGKDRRVVRDHGEGLVGERFRFGGVGEAKKETVAIAFAWDDDDRRGAAGNVHVPYGRLTGGSGVGWVLTVLHQQACYAFAEPRLALSLVRKSPSIHPMTLPGTAAAAVASRPPALFLVGAATSTRTHTTSPAPRLLPNTSEESSARCSNARSEGAAPTDAPASALLLHQPPRSPHCATATAAGPATPLTPLGAATTAAVFLTEVPEAAHTIDLTERQPVVDVAPVFSKHTTAATTDLLSVVCDTAASSLVMDALGVTPLSPPVEPPGTEALADAQPPPLSPLTEEEKPADASPVGKKVRHVYSAPLRRRQPLPQHIEAMSTLCEGTRKESFMRNESALLGADSTAALRPPTAEPTLIAAPPRCTSSQPPQAPRLSPYTQNGPSTLPRMPVHRTLLARTGSAGTSRPRPATASTTASRTTHTSARLVEVFYASQESLPRSSAAPPVLERPQPSTSRRAGRPTSVVSGYAGHTCQSLLTRSGTTK